VGRVSASLLALLLGAAAAVALASCGSGSDAKLLPGSTAGEITTNLDRVKQMVSEGDCVGAEDATQLVAAQIDELGNVDKKLKQALREGTSLLESEVASECVEETVETIEPSEPLTEAETAKPKPPKKEEKEKKPKQEEKPKEEETTPAPTPPPLPPQAKGEAKGHEPSAGEEEELVPPSGGVGPGSTTGEGD
jgi:outer membrane biosynthesis protein TonB